MVILGIAVLGLIGIRAWENQKKQTGDGSYSAQTMSQEEKDIPAAEPRSMKDGKQLRLDPGEYFGVDGIYYQFVNFDELWDEFVEWNSSL